MIAVLCTEYYTIILILLLEPACLILKNTYAVECRISVAAEQHADILLSAFGLRSSI